MKTEPCHKCKADFMEAMINQFFNPLPPGSAVDTFKGILSLGFNMLNTHMAALAETAVRNTITDGKP